MRSLLLFGLFAAFAAAQVRYDGYQVLRTAALDKAAAEYLRTLQVEANLDFWKDPVTGRSADIAASPDFLPQLKAMLDEHKITYTVMIEDIQKLHESTLRTDSRSVAGFDWNDYSSHDDITAFMNSFVDENNPAISLVSIGQSYEGRDMKVLSVQEAGAGKPNVWIEAGIHAREWIAPAVATWLIKELMGDKGAKYRESLNFHILPNANPDGYEYSRDTNKGDRLWRKNRSPQQGNCVGVDLNRNWGFHWAESGVSNNPCSDVFCGTDPDSEPETKNIQKYVKALEPTPVLGHCIHSYSQLWLWPYGYAYNAYPDNYKEIRQLAIDASEALYDVHGTVFDPINSADLYPAAGASDDWYKGVLGTRYAFTTELRDTGRYGFVLPPEQIIPSGEEMWAGMSVVFDKLIEDMKNP